MSLEVYILAAGEGSRMRSSIPKVLFPIAGNQALLLLLKEVVKLKPTKMVLVLSPEMKTSIESIKKKLNSEIKISIIYQKELMGTAASLLAAKEHWSKSKLPVLVLNGDMPLVTAETLKSFVDFYKERDAKATIVTLSLQNPFGYGRVIRGHSGKIEEILEEIDIKGKETDISEVNAGCYIFDPELLREVLPKLKKSRSGEYYLTDLIYAIVKKGENIITFSATDYEEFLGMNTRSQHAELCRIMQSRINTHWMDNGVSILSPESTWIDLDVKIGCDVIISSNVHLVGDTKIGNKVVIEPNSIIKRSKIDEGCIIKAGSYLEECEVKKEAIIGPYARLRPGTKIGKGAKVGNFTELKNSTLGDGSKANHLSYIGDAVIGKNVNIGAGVITCNYDGGLRYEGKAKTVVGDNAFIGSDVQLIAPIKISEGSYVASGSSIVNNVPPHSLAIARVRQENKKDFIKKYKKRKQR